MLPIIRSYFVGERVQKKPGDPGFRGSQGALPAGQQGPAGPGAYPALLASSLPYSIPRPWGNEKRGGMCSMYVPDTIRLRFEWKKIGSEAGRRLRRLFELRSKLRSRSATFFSANRFLALLPPEIHALIHRIVGHCQRQHLIRAMLRRQIKRIPK